MHACMYVCMYDVIRTERRTGLVVSLIHIPSGERVAAVPVLRAGLETARVHVAALVGVAAHTVLDVYMYLCMYVECM
jgi:hypothetical protein